MITNLHHLVCNPNAVPSSEVLRYLHDGDTSYDELVSVLGRDLVERLTKNSTPSYELPPSGPADRVTPDYAEFTQVYVWGAPRSGKTCVIGALLAALSAECQRTYPKGDSSNQPRYDALLRYFLRDGWHYDVLSDPDRSEVARYDVEACLRTGLLQGRRYPLSFVEADLDRFVAGTLDVPSPNNHQLHLLCLDCSAPERERGAQARQLVELLERLREKGMLGCTSGIYLLVTKVDTMQSVPQRYRREAAQTLVTAALPELWQKVQSLCYDMEIYDARPLPFSVGDVVLQDIVRPQLAPARGLITQHILPRSEPRLSRWESLLHAFGWVGTLLVSLLVIAAVALAAREFFHTLPSPPLDTVVPYHFGKDFLEREKALMALSYDDAKARYKELHWELKIERDIRTSDGNLLSDVTPECTRRLWADFGEKVKRWYRDVYAQPHWSTSHATELQSAGECVGWLNQEADYLQDEWWVQGRKDSLALYRRYYTNLPHVRDIIGQARNCIFPNETLAKIDSLIHYFAYPYQCDETLKEGILRGPKQACNSCLTALRSRYIWSSEAFSDECRDSLMVRLSRRAGRMPQESELRQELEELVLELGTPHAEETDVEELIE